MTEANHPYRFPAQFGEHTRHLDFVIENEEPVKLGDGTFGCVFLVRESDEKNYALKIFYENKDPFISASQKNESEIGRRLRTGNIQSQKQLDAFERYLVLPQGHASDFTSSEAYKSLEDYFDRLSFKVSGQAIVMNYYPMSLKDLLERGWPISPSEDDTDSSPPPKNDAAIGRGSERFGSTSGYSILGKLRQEERENSLLPFAQDIAKALSLLHDAGVNHQDIKPANVLMRTVGKNIESALADLGFIDAGLVAHGSAYQNRPLGTRHYRAPEQTDSFDICEVDIERTENGGYKLKTRDPKFLETFSEKGDFIVFSKFEKKTQWEIEKIQREEREDGGQETTIRVRNLSEIQLAEDKKTQVTIHKKQTARTDLFGLGAIMYDMLTCGRSPERFYDLLRARDKENETIDDGLAQKYFHFSNGGGTVPEIDAIFQNLKTEPTGEFPSLEIVKIILKCMMSRPKDSYYRRHRWTDVENDLAALIGKQKSHEYSEWQRNYLTNNVSPENQVIREQQSSPLQQLCGIQNLSYSDPKECVKRIVLGVRFLQKIFDMVGNEIEGGDDFNYLSDISTRSLIERKRVFEPKIAFFETEAKLDAALTSVNPMALIQVFSAGSLRPPFIQTLVRECEIWTNKTNGDANGQIRLPFDLWGANFAPDGVNKGDRLVIDISPSQRESKEILGVENGCLIIDKEGNLNLQDAITKRTHAYIVKQIRPSDYYVSMLGVYIRLVFFVNSNEGHKHVPQAIYYFEQARSIREMKLSTVPDGGSTESDEGSPFSISQWWLSGKSQDMPERPQTMDDLFYHLAYLYVRFVTRDLKDSKDTSEIHRLWDTLKKAVVKLLAWKQEELLHDDSADDLTDKIDKKNLQLSVKTFPDIDKLSNDIVLSCKSDPERGASRS